VTIEKLGLKVLCDSAYETLRRHRGQQNKLTTVANTAETDARVVALFTRLVVPEIQREVSTGPRFGLLRQILSVTVISKWIKESQLGAALKQAGFAESNDPGKYRLNVVDVAVLQSLKQLYLQMFGDGIWQWTRTHIRMDSGMAEKRLYVAGGIEMDWMKQR
jgi:hypothetical protein